MCFHDFDSPVEQLESCFIESYFTAQVTEEDKIEALNLCLHLLSEWKTPNINYSTPTEALKLKMNEDAKHLIPKHPQNLRIKTHEKEKWQV